MEVADVTAIVEKAVARYRVFTLALAGAFARTLEGNRPTAPTARRALESEVQGLAAAFVEHEANQVIDQSFVLALSALSDARDALAAAKPEAQRGEQGVDAGERTSVIVDDVIAALRAQATRDVRAVVNRLWKVAIEVDMLQAQRGWSYAASLIRVREHNKGVTFRFTDRAGRRWDAERYIQTLLREHYFGLYNEVFMHTLAGYGINEGRVKAPDSANDGMAFAFVDDGGALPSYEALRASVFHPNSLALVAAL